MTRPSSYSEPIAKIILEKLSQGQSLNKICKPKGMPDAHVVRFWCIENVQGFGPKFDAARTVGLDARAERLLEWSYKALKACRGDNSKLAGATVNAIRLIVDTEKWLLSKLGPKIYGDRQTTEHVIDRRPVDESEIDLRLRELERKVSAAPDGPPIPEDQRQLPAPAESALPTLDATVEPQPEPEPIAGHK